MRPWVWSYEQIHYLTETQPWPAEAFDALRRVAIHDGDSYLVFDADDPSYVGLRLELHAYADAHKAQEDDVGVIEKAKRFIPSIVSHGKNVIVPATDAQIRERLGVCCQCRYMMSRSLSCAICGCQFHQKLTVAADSCPIFNWRLARGEKLNEQQLRKRKQEIEIAEKRYIGKLLIPLVWS